MGSALEPTSTSGAAAAIGWKLIGGLAGLGAIGAALAAVVVICMRKPRSTAEWAVGIISTVVSSIAGGAAVIVHFNLQHWVNSGFGLVAMLGLVFACGLPGWAIVRWVFNFIIAREGKDILQVVNEARGK